LLLPRLEAGPQLLHAVLGPLAEPLRHMVLVVDNCDITMAPWSTLVLVSAGLRPSTAAGSTTGMPWRQDLGQAVCVASTVDEVELCVNTESRVKDRHMMSTSVLLGGFDVSNAAVSRPSMKPLMAGSEHTWLKPSDVFKACDAGPAFTWSPNRRSCGAETADRRHSQKPIKPSLDCPCA